MKFIQRVLGKFESKGRYKFSITKRTIPPVAFHYLQIANDPEVMSKGEKCVYRD